MRSACEIITVVCSVIKWESIKMDVAVNEGKTKRVLSENNDMLRILCYLLPKNVFILPLQLPAIRMCVSLVAKRSINHAKRYCYGLSRQLNSTDLSPMTKRILYKCHNLPVLLYGANAWIF